MIEWPCYDPAQMVWEIPFQTTTDPAPDAKLYMAAVRYGDRVMVGWRHGSIMQAVARIEKLSSHNPDDQGFVDQYKNFYRRSTAASLAYSRGQIRRIPSTLFSEDLWDNDGTPRKPEPFNPTGDQRAT